MTKKITPIQQAASAYPAKPQSEDSDKKEYQKTKQDKKTREENNDKTRPHHGLFDEYT